MGRAFVVFVVLLRGGLNVESANAIRFVARDDVAASPLGEDLALLDLVSGEYYTLNATGSFLWQQLADPRTETELSQAMCGVFEVDDASALTAVRTYLSGLVERGLARQADA